MTAMNKIEERALEMVKNGEPIHGEWREILINMQMREMEKEA